MLPKAIVFDLDYTLWPCWCDTHISTPLKQKNETTIKDAYGFELSFYRDVGAILEYLRENKVLIFSASRTSAPQVALKMLKMLRINDEPAINFFVGSEWGYFSKTKHLSKLSEEYDVPFEEMILYDDEMRNIDVERELGVTFAHIPNEDIGLTWNIFNKGIEKWEKYRLKS